jgi:hypothetical protein
MQTVGKEAPLLPLQYIFPHLPFPGAEKEITLRTKLHSPNPQKHLGWGLNGPDGIPVGNTVGLFLGKAGKNSKKAKKYTEF